MVFGALNVLVTHLKESLKAEAPKLLGLQETYDLLERLKNTHPVAVEDFLQNRTNLRRLRNILQNLLRERISIRDLLTIVETAGEHLEELDKTELVTEYVRMALSHQICAQYLDEGNVLRALALSDEWEEFLLGAIKDDRGKAALAIERSDVDYMVSEIKSIIEQQGAPPVLLCSPPLRPYLARLLKRALPSLAVLSLAEIAPGVHLETAGQVKRGGSKKQRESRSGREKKPIKTGFWRIEN
jgi:flagellar biosynthesis protein FlhA